MMRAGDIEVPAAPSSSADAAVDEVQATLVGHRLEPVDAIWANQAQLGLRADLLSLRGKFPLDVGLVDCRSVTCVADLSWRSFAEYRSNALTLLGSPLQLNCRESITLQPKVPDENGRFHSPLIVDCTEQRALEKKPQPPEAATAGHAE